MHIKNRKLRRYDLLASEFEQIYKSMVKIFSYVMTWEGLVTVCHKRYSKEIGILPKTEAYIQSTVLRKTLESISLERRRGLEEQYIQEESEVVV